MSTPAAVGPGPLPQPVRDGADDPPPAASIAPDFSTFCTPDGKGYTDSPALTS